MELRTNGSNKARSRRQSLRRGGEAGSGEAKALPSKSELETVIERAESGEDVAKAVYISGEEKLTKLSKEDIKSIKEASKVKIQYNNNIHKDHRMRLKTQFLENGINSMTEVQILELLLFYSIPQKDTNPLAHKLLKEFTSIKGVLSAPTEELMNVVGIKQNSATLLKLVHGLINYTSVPKGAKVINTTFDAKDYCQKLFHGIDVEQFYVICLSKENEVKKMKMIALGTMDEISLQIRNITEFVLLSRCNRIVICHNHPSGKGRVSDEDMSFTYSLLCSCLLNSIDILDHVIVGTNRTISMNEQGMLQSMKQRAFNTLQLSGDQKLIISASSKKFVTSDPNRD